MDARIDEIADGIFRLSVRVDAIAPPAGFTFNHFLVLGDDPLLFHTGLRGMFPILREAVGRLIPPERLRWISFGHYEADECGAMNEWLSVAPGEAAEKNHWYANVWVADAPIAVAPGNIYKMDYSFSEFSRRSKIRIHTE